MEDKTYNLERARAVSSHIQTSVVPAERELLYDLARRTTNRGCIVEIGSWRGCSTIFLGHGSKAGAGAPVYAIDPHTGSSESHRHFGEINTLDEFKANMEGAGLSGLVQPIVATSAAAAEDWTEPIELLFIDGAHDYEFVRMDWDLWVPHVIEGGWVALHDTNVSEYPGVKRVVKESIFASNNYRNVHFVGSLLVAQKVTRCSFKERVGRGCAHILRYPDDWARTLNWQIIPRPVRKLAHSLLTRLK